MYSKFTKAAAWRGYAKLKKDSKSAQFDYF
jgi:hypothetical protein